MTTCIICIETKPTPAFHPEHVFPFAIGGRMVIHEVCDSCNHRLGTAVDAPLTNHWLIQGRRMLLGLAGNSGKVPNPLERAYMADEPTHRLRYAIDPDGGPGRLITRQSVQRTPRADGTESITVTLDKSEAARLPDIVNRILQRAGHSRLQADEILKHAVLHSVPMPQVGAKVEIDIIEYKRGILKIAYELAFRWLGSAYLNDPVATTIREYLFASGPSAMSASPLRGRVDFVGQPPLIPHLWDRHLHVGFLVSSADHVAICVQIFDIMEAQLIVSNDPQRYSMPAGMFVTNDAVTGEVREGLLADELARIETADGLRAG